MKIVRNETVRTVAGIGAVAFKPIARANAYYRQHYGRTHQMAFRFEHNGREYWGEVIRHFDRHAPHGSRVTVETELRTRSGDHSRALAESHKLEWRAALVAEFKRELESFVAAADVASAPEVAAAVDAMPVEPMAEPATEAAEPAGDVLAIRDKLAPVLVANTTRACYWRTAGGLFVATGADVGAADVPNNGGGYARLDSLMLAKGETAETIRRVAALNCAAPAPLARIASRTIDGTEWLGAFGWSADIRAAYVLTLADAEAVAKLETDKERARPARPDAEPGDGRYSIVARPYDAPALYTLADYREEEAEAERMAAHYGEAVESVVPAALARLESLLADWPTMRALSAVGAAKAGERKAEARELVAAIRSELGA